MKNRSEFERQLDNIIFPGFADDIKERASVIVAIRELVEKRVPRACQSDNHSPFECCYLDDDEDPVWQCSECSKWLCYTEALHGDDRCEDCRPIEILSVS
jgi:hypothetical protein